MKKTSNMRNLIFLLSVITIFASCSDVRTEYSDTIREKAVVVTMIYSPSEHHTDITPTMLNQGSTFGTDYNGDLGVRIGKNYQITQTTIPEKFGVVFQCQHGTFTIEGSEGKHRVLYDKLRTNVHDTVDVLYREEYTATYEKDEKSGEKKLVSRVLTDLDFIDAQLAPKK